MSRKLFAGVLFALACTVTVYANAATVDEAPAPRPVAAGEKKVEEKGDAKPGFGGKFGKGFDKSKIDPEKLKELKEKFGDKFGKGGFDKSKIDPEKLKELKEKFGDKFGKGGFDKSKIDPEKLKELKEKFGKEKGE